MNMGNLKLMKPMHFMGVEKHEDETIIRIESMVEVHFHKATSLLLENQRY